jgi:hypothetical protein
MARYVSFPAFLVMSVTLPPAAFFPVFSADFTPTSKAGQNRVYTAMQVVGGGWKEA